MISKKYIYYDKKEKVGAVIGASSEAIHAIKTAQDMGIYVVALDGNSNAEGLEQADKVYVVDINNIGAVTEILMKEKVSFIIPVPIGRCLSVIGAINTLLNLPGIQQHPAEICTDKLEFHRRLKDAGLRNIEAYVLDKDQIASVQEMNLPVIIKPRYGSGNHGVTMISSLKELHQEIDRIMPLEEEYICETAVTGQEYGLDGVVIDGELHVILLRKKVITDPPMRQCVGYYTVPKDKDKLKLYGKIEEYLSKVVQELGLDHSIIHGDIMVNAENIFLIEISGRPSGHHLHDILVPLATNVDLIKEYLNYILGMEYNVVQHQIKHMALHFWNFENGYIEKVPNLEALQKEPSINMIDYQCHILEGSYLDIIRDDTVLDRGYFIVEGDSIEDIERQCNTILDNFVVKYTGKRDIYER